ncbi:MAG TPA: glycosyltransferase family 4 protein [Candidatus Limnocylindria bacterium]|nr:glycosyltransferase family 4 protein [Candidatus Limnocylindria bacterium]
MSLAPRRLRIAIFHLGFFYSGGGEKLVLQEARELRARGHVVEVYAPIVDPDVCFPELMAEIAPRRLLPRLPNVAGIGDGLTLLASAVLARSVVRDITADVFLGANQPGAWLARAAAMRTGKRYVVYLNQPNRLLNARAVDLEARSLVMKRDFFLLDTAASLGRPILNILDRRSVRDAAVRLGDGDYMTGVLTTHYGGAWRSCPASTVPAAAEPTDQAERSAGSVQIGRREVQRPYVLLTNRHYPQKRFEDMLPVIARVRERHPEAMLVITGADTPYTDVLRRRVAALGLRPAVRFMGLVGEDALRRLYRGAAAYVYPSPEEDFGMGIVEAMGHGTPVVAWDHAGPTGIITDGLDGHRVTLGDLDAFSERVVRLMDDPALRERIGRAAWRTAVARFSFAAHTDIVERALYEAV